MSDISPPLDYLLSCSQSSLESLELSRLNLAANLRKQARQILEKCIQSEVEARMARWILEHRRMQCPEAGIDEPETAEKRLSGSRSYLPAPVQAALPMAKDANSGTLPLPGLSTPARTPDGSRTAKRRDAEVSIAASAARAIGALGEAKIANRKVSRLPASGTVLRKVDSEVPRSAPDFEHASKQSFPERCMTARPTQSELGDGSSACQISASALRALERPIPRRTSKSRSVLKKSGNEDLAGVSMLPAERTIVLIRSLRMASFDQPYLSTSRRAACYAIA